MHNVCQAGKTNKYMQDTEITGKMCRKGLMSLQIAIKEGKSLLLPVSGVLEQGENLELADRDNLCAPAQRCWGGGRQMRGLKRKW